MATRKIIDAKHNGEKVWLKGHAQATYLSNGSTVEDALNSIQSGGITAETDPIFLASPAASITEAKKTEWDNKMDKVVLSPVATSGNYNDLTNKPTIPASVTESTVSGWGFTKNTGTITGVSANGTSVATSGVANIPAATTSKYGVTKLSSATNSTSTSLAATASAVKSAYDLANGRQEKLVSGTNIKTINNTSILGSGNIAIDANIQAVDTQETLDDVETNTYVKYVAQTLTEEQKAQVRENIGVVEGGKEIIANKQGIDSIFVFANDSANGPLEPNKIYVSPFTVTFGIIIENIISPTDLYAEYTIIFKTGGGANYEGELMLPSYVLWANGTIPTLEAQTHYELSISATKIDNEYFYKAVIVPFKSV